VGAGNGGADDCDGGAGTPDWPGGRTVDDGGVAEPGGWPDAVGELLDDEGDVPAADPDEPLPHPARAHRPTARATSTLAFLIT
jgi:hypothetical protein